MVASFVLILLPNDLLAPTKNVTQVISPLQILTLEATRGITEPIRTLAERAPSAREHADLGQEKQALENEAFVLREEMARLQTEIDELTGIRRQGFPARGALIPARQIALDAVPGRDSLVVSKGHVQNVSRNDWVTSRLAVDAGTEDGVQDAFAVLARQCLIGWVEQAAPLTSRVVLLSDPVASRPVRVHLAPTDSDGKHRLLAVNGQPIPFALEGTGGGRMRIRDIAASLVDTGAISQGDLVTSDPNNPRLPLAMVIGRIEELTQNRDNPVCYDAVVGYLFHPKHLSQVYIADLSRTGAITPSAAKP